MREVLQILLWTSIVLAGKPPQLQPDTRNLEQIVVLGNNVTVRCPILKPVDFVVWKHDAKELDFSVRYRPSNKGWLKIAHVTKDDAGRYTCQAVNGFGSVEANITLVVHDPNGESPEIIQQHNFYPETDTNLNEKDKYEKPALLEASRFRFETIQRPTGSSVKLKCLMTGSPKPKVYWMKNNKKLSRADLNAASLISRWSLNLMNLKDADSGLYTCVGQNEHGTVNKSFTLEVIGRIDSKPELMGKESVNITVFAGNTASFHCRVKSAVPPHMKWLKQVKEDDAGRQLVFENASYKVLKSGEAMEYQGTFLYKLQIQNVRESDSSKYICMALNIQGYSAGVYYLRVLTRTEQESRKTASLPITMIAISIVFVLSVAVVGFLLAKKYRYMQVKKSQPTQQPQEPVLDDASSCFLQQESASQVVSNASTSSSHYHHHHHQHHHYKCKQLRV